MAWSSLSTWKLRARSLRATATVAMWVPRRAAVLGIEGSEGRAGLGPLGGLLEHEPDPRRAHLGDVAVADLTVGVAHRRGQPGPGTQLASGREPADVADLGHQGHGGDRADPGQGLQRLDAWVRP